MKRVIRSQILPSIMVGIVTSISSDDGSEEVGFRRLLVTASSDDLKVLLMKKEALKDSRQSIQLNKS